MSFLKQSRRWVSRLACVALISASTTAINAEDPVAADKTAPAQERTEDLLRSDARLKAEAGDFRGALLALQGAAGIAGDRTTAARAGEMADQLAAGGGNNFADFTELIQLIQDQTTTDDIVWAQGPGEPGGRMSQFAQGVFVGVPAFALSQTAIDGNARLHRAAMLAQTANRNQDARVSSRLRLVSLKRLEQAVGEAEASGLPLSEDLLTLAGINRIDYVFAFPAERDIVIGGPAGNWERESETRLINPETGRPVLQLEDLITLLKTFGPDGSGYLMCTIDPKQSQVKAVNDFVRNSPSPTRRTLRQWTKGLEQTLGLQDVRVEGIPANCRVANVIVETDYQMKLVGIGRRPGAQGMKSYFNILTPSERQGSGSMEALRWWMTTQYDAVGVSPDGNAFSLTTAPVRCLSENQIVGANGQRQRTGAADRPNQEFAKLFTEHLPALAKADVMFADLENIFDLAMVAALIHDGGIGNKVGWTPRELASRDSLVREYDVPTELMTAAESRAFRDGSLVTQVAGGVRADLREVVLRQDLFESDAELASSERAANPIGHSADQWWWDAAEGR